MEMEEEKREIKNKEWKIRRGYGGWNEICLNVEENYESNVKWINVRNLRNSYYWNNEDGGEWYCEREGD